MNSLIKIRDVSAKYGISARTLRYYEDTGLLDSTRSDDHAGRLYDEAAVRRLEQILILRKLNISIKDIKRIFETDKSEVVLEVLGKKVNDIDEEVALLHELKEMVITFIRQIEQADFRKDSDVTWLYGKAREIETQLVGGVYTGNPSPAHRLFELAEQLESKAVSRLMIPDNVLKRMLQNVYFIWGDGVAVADELGRRHGIFVYHTCEHRSKHSRHADPRFQPGLSTLENIPDFFAQDPEDALRREQEIIHDFTPMVIMDLIQLTATHEKVICENDIDINSILPFVTHAVTIANQGLLNDFCNRYEDEIRSRDISEDEKEQLLRKVKRTWRKKADRTLSTEALQYGVKQIIWDDLSTVEQTADRIAEYFGWPLVTIN